MNPRLIAPPAFLYRFYDHAEFAIDMLSHGRLRMRRVEYYKHVEAAFARDADEGEGRLRVPGLVPVVEVSRVTGEFRDVPPVQGHFHFSTTWMQPTYVFCTSDPGASITEMTKDRPYVVRIADPPKFFESLAAAVGELVLDGRQPVLLEGVHVRYDKDAIEARPDDDRERTRLSYAQKPPRFASEIEYRFAMSLSGPAAGAPEYLDFVLREPGRFCERFVPHSAG